MLKRVSLRRARHCARPPRRTPPRPHPLPGRALPPAAPAARRPMFLEHASFCSVFARLVTPALTPSTSRMVALLRGLLLVGLLVILAVPRSWARLHFTKTTPLPDGVSVTVLNVPDDCAVWDPRSKSAVGDTLYVHYVGLPRRQVGLQSISPRRPFRRRCISTTVIKLQRA